jgi:hypothetical protein
LQRVKIGFDGTANGAQGGFCAFEFPGCEGCQYALHAIKTVNAFEDPMKSAAWCGQIIDPVRGIGQPWNASCATKTFRFF